MKRTVALLLLCLLTVACNQPLQDVARDSIAGAKGFIEEAQRNHLAECTATPSKSLCQSINRAVDAQNAAVTALHAYCASEIYENGGPCTPQGAYKEQLKSAISSLNRFVNELKGAIR